MARPRLSEGAKRAAAEAGAEPPATPTDDMVERAVAAAPWIALRGGLVVLGLGLAAWFVSQVSSVLLLAFIAVILAAAIAGPVSWLEHRGVPGGLAVVSIYSWWRWCWASSWFSSPRRSCSS